MTINVKVGNIPNADFRYLDQFSDSLGTTTLADNYIVLAYKDGENSLLSDPNKTVDFKCTTSAENNISMAVFEGTQLYRKGAAPLLRSTRAAPHGVVNLFNGADHITMQGFHLNIGASSMKYVADRRTVAAADSVLNFDNNYGTHDAGLESIQAFKADVDSISTPISFNNCIFEANRNAIFGRNSNRASVSTENTVFYNKHGGTSYSGVLYVKAHKIAAFGFGTAAGYDNVKDVDPASSYIATDDASGLNGLANLSITDCFYDPANEGWWLKDNSPLKGAGPNSEDICNLVQAPVAETAAFTTPLIVDGSRVSETSIGVTATSATNATVQLILTSRGASRPTDAAFDASALKVSVKAGEVFNISDDSRPANTEYAAHVRLKPFLGTSAYAEIDVKTTPVAPSITSVNAGNPLIPGAEFEILGSGLTDHTEIYIGSTEQLSFTVHSDTRATAIAVRPNDLDNNVSGSINIGGTPSSITFISGVGWGSAVISALASENLLPVAPALELGDKVYHESQGLDLNVYADGSYLLNSTNATEQVAVDIFRNGIWLDRQTLTLSRTNDQTNNPPRITSANSVNVTAGQTVTYEATAIDDDGDTVEITFSILPSGSTVSGSTVTIPTNTSSTDYQLNFNVIADDKKGGVTTQNVTVYVARSQVNTAPVVTSATEITLEVGQALSHTIVATDSDTLTYSLSGSDGYTISGSTVTHPAFTEAGQQQFTHLVSDGVNNPVSTTVTINVVDRAAQQARFTDTLQDEKTKQMINENNMTVLLSQKGVAKGSASFNCVNGQMNVVVQGAVVGEKYSALYEDAAGNKVGSVVLTAQAV